MSHSMKKLVILFLLSFAITFSCYGQKTCSLSLNDSLRIMGNQLTGQWRAVEFIAPDTVITWPTRGVIEVMELSFFNPRRGRIREDSMLDGEWYTISTCQSVPALKLINDRYVLHFTDPYGDRIMFIELEDDQLTLRSDSEILKYTRLEK